ncbi:hypothetical protein QBC40DRAFT_293980 [Triangularia verruculosa]|uniref:Uncharacterized protein n=1 Tax=Triangularia verruculosa TaxID=2587418 RepID=A0AAN6XQ26_9PEZI|nr:hypothetical protein QBC40DRAFT_293980 [Triangularia verruculosa]
MANSDSDDDEVSQLIQSLEAEDLKRVVAEAALFRTTSFKHVQQTAMAAETNCDLTGNRLDYDYIASLVKICPHNSLLLIAEVTFRQYREARQHVRDIMKANGTLPSDLSVFGGIEDDDNDSDSRQIDFEWDRFQKEYEEFREPGCGKGPEQLEATEKLAKAARRAVDNIASVTFRQNSYDEKFNAFCTIGKICDRMSLKAIMAEDERQKEIFSRVFGDCCKRLIRVMLLFTPEEMRRLAEEKEPLGESNWLSNLKTMMTVEAEYSKLLWKNKRVYKIFSLMEEKTWGLARLH